ncbi:MAG: NUDIX domain-containing protein [Bacillota bacterium]
MSDYDWERIPKKRSSSGAIIFNKNEKLLIVKPTYREKWLIPGGVDEYNESPLSSCRREIKEEIGLNIEIEKLLSFDYKPGSESYLEGFSFIFYGGKLSDEQISQIKLQKEEISEYKFIEKDRISKMLVDKLKQRVLVSLDALDNDTSYYLEGQEQVL